MVPAVPGKHPHLTELQKKYKDQGLIVIGITDENNPLLLAFVAKMGDKMNYTVAYDDNHKTNAAYIQAFGLRGIPHAFVIDVKGVSLGAGTRNSAGTGCGTDHHRQIAQPPPGPARKPYPC